jgi:signal transduction histidine kinase
VLPVAGPSHPDLRILFGAFVAVAAIFAAANGLAQYVIGRVDSASTQIAYNSAPSIEHLAKLRSAVRQSQLLVERQAHKRGSSGVEVEGALAQVNTEARAYLDLPTFPGEKDYWHRLEDGLDRFDRAVHRAVAQQESRKADRSRRNLAEVDASADQLLVAISEAVEFNARNGAALALQIKAVRGRAAWVGIGLTAVCVAFTILAGLLVRKQVRRYGALVDEHAALQELRASELETFAGRAAHDILNPVAATQMALQLALQRTPREVGGRELVERALRNVQRIRTIVDGLLQFARSGARPPPGARAELQPVVEDVVAGAHPAAERAGIALEVEPLPPAWVACSPGVLASLVSNLVHNAVKYVGERADARIHVRARLLDDRLRVEVEDNGPGVPADGLSRIFLPWERGSASGQEGLGLGLATVRRLAESHGGQAGVQSVLGEGSVFWFELPPARSVRPARRGLLAARPPKPPHLGNAAP